MTFLETAARLLSLVQADMENGYRCAIEEVARLPLSGDKASDAAIYLACDIVHALAADTEDDGWALASRVPFDREELYDLWEAGLIEEPCESEGGLVRFQLRDE